MLVLERSCVLRPVRGIVLSLLSLAAVFSVPRTSNCQARPHTIQGRITGDSGSAIAAADVIVTIAPTAETVIGKSDASGGYKLTIANPTGEYILNISAPGFRPFHQRVTIVLGDSIATVNAKLSANVQQLVGVRVQATRPRPPRTLGNDATFGADPGSKTVDGVTNALPPELQGNIDAMATLIPGYSSVPGGGFSAFGLTPDANLKTINGLSFSGEGVPRDLSTSTRYVASPWDPTRGGFSGALASTTINRGSNIFQSRARLTLDAPSLQIDDRIAERFGQRFTGLQLGGGKSGPLSLDRYFYNAGYSASVTRTPVSSLLDLDPAALLHAGISPDSAARMIQIVRVAGVPLAIGGIPDQRTMFSGSFAERFDFARPNPPRGQTPLPQWNTIVIANYSETRGSALEPTSLPATAGKNQNGVAQVQGMYSRYFGKFGDYINETSAGLSFSEQKSTPYLALPSGNVLIASTFANAEPTIGSLNFGGNNGFARDNRTAAFEFNNLTTFLINDHPSLPTNIYFQGRYEHFDQLLNANGLGSFSYASLADLAANRPSGFTRVLNTPNRSGGEFLGAAAIGSSYSTLPLVITGGVRMDANAFTGLPAFNPAIEQAFGVRNNAAPNSVALSPRVGFNWYYKTHTPSNSMSASPFAVVARGGPSIRGGVGEFRNFLRSNLLSDAIGATGLPGSAEQLVCVGSAAPPPNWQAYLNDPSAIPSACAGGSSAFADTAHTAVLFDPSYTPMRSWRATLGWTNTVLGNYLAVDGTYSLNLNQPGVVDINFAGAPKFRLGAEGGRPVFVSPTSIVPSTGIASAVESRRAIDFARVSDRVSDLRGDTRQLTAYVIPSIPFRFGLVTMGYTWSDSRSQARGFDQSTAADPRAIDWAPVATQPRHQIIVQAARPVWRFLYFTTSVKISSGLRYTPVVAGDVNGDGWFNDRAFVFDPSSSDTSLARGLRELMANGSASARHCLTRQINSLAGRNSCVGPWSAMMNAGVFAANIPGTDGRLNITLNLTNPLSGLDQLLHGSDKLHGWGTMPFPDGTLYQVRGFDPVAQRYTYQVNPRFGNTNPALTTIRSPFRLTIDVRYDYGPNSGEQALILAVRKQPSLAGTRAPVDTIRRRYFCGSSSGTSGFSDIYRWMLGLADSIALSRDQVDKMQQRQVLMRSRADSIYGELATYLAALPMDFSAKQAVDKVTETETAVWRVIYGEAPFIKDLLTPGQVRLLPLPIFNMVTAISPSLNSRFYFGNACP